MELARFHFCRDARRPVFFKSLPCALACVVLFATASRADPPAPVSATFVSKRIGKPPSREIRASLVLANPTRSTLWYVLPDFCDDPPSMQGTVRMARGFGPEQIGAAGYNTGAYHHLKPGNTGKAIVLTVSTNDQSFRLLRLPPGGTVKFESYSFQMISEYRHAFRVWTADRITVNDKASLELWLPYRTLSDPQVFVQAGTDWDNLDFDTRTSATRTDYRKERITKLDLHITGSWKIPFKGYE